MRRHVRQREDKQEFAASGPRFPLRPANATSRYCSYCIYMQMQHAHTFHQTAIAILSIVVSVDSPRFHPLR